MSHKRWIIFFITLCFPILHATPPITFEQSAFLGNGSLKLYGELIRNAINARFSRINKLGGIAGRNLKLVSMDDRGEPEITQKNINIMRKRGIDMFLGNMGTRSIFKVLPLIENKDIAMLFPWGGDERLRKPHLTNLINGLGLMAPQLDKIIEYIFEDLRLKKIAIFYDDSTFGKENKNETITRLKSIGHK